MSKLDEILDEWADEVETTVVDPGLTHAQSLEARADAYKAIKQQIKELYYDLAADCFPNDENFKKFIQKVDEL